MPPRRFLPFVLCIFSLAACSGDQNGAPSKTPPPKTAPANAESASPQAPAAVVEKPPAGVTPIPAKAEAPPPAPVTATTKPIDGEQIVRGVCMACHEAGMNGAPKFGDKFAWKPRIAQGRDKLYEHAMKGFRGMPPHGGNPTLSDDQIKAGVDYMVKAAGGYPN